MAYDAVLADRIRALMMFESEVTEKAMFGGLAFLVGGHMALAVSNTGGLLLRCEVDQTDSMLARPLVEPFVMRGRVMNGWVRVTDEGCQTDEQLREWIRIGTDVARGMLAQS